jgi:hypothetical protein
MIGENQELELLDDLLDSARRHGKASEPDHEVGDLQDALRIAWASLSASQRRAVHRAYFVDHERWRSPIAETRRR